MAGEYHKDPSTGREFSVNATDARPEAVAEDVAYSPFTGERLEPELEYPEDEPEAELEYPEDEPEADEEG